jgi:predicted dehydrogenase
VNLGDWLVGPIDRLVADAAHLALQGVEVEDTAHLLARHGRVMASYTLNQHQAPNETTFTVICERGTARFEAHNRRWCWMIAPDTTWQEESLPALERDELFVRQAHAFLDAVEGKGAPLCTLAEGERTLRVNLAALSSADELSGWVRV